MMLSEKASAFRIENLLSKNDQKPNSTKKITATSFSDCDTTAPFTSCSSKSSSTSSLNSSLFNDCVDSSNKSSDTSTSATPYPNKHKKSVPIKIVHDFNNQSPSQFSPVYSSPSNSPPPPPPASNKRKIKHHEPSEPNKQHKSCIDKSLSSEASHCTDQYENSTMTKAKIESYKGNDKVLAEIECFLETDDLWKRFHELGTEMIITKSGRRMFPSLRVSFSGAHLTEKYLIAMDIVPTDCKRYRYAYHRSSWLVAGKADPPVQSRLFIHPDGPFTGETLFKQIISFEKVKLTNNEMDKCGHVVLNSMHKYQPRVHIIKRPDERGSMSNNSMQSALQLSSDLSNYDYKTFVFPETSFIAVTAYQNQLITKLKIDSNPFAKGFRDSSRLSDLEKESIEQLIKDNNNNNTNTSCISSNINHNPNSSSISSSNSDIFNEIYSQSVSQHQSQVQTDVQPKAFEGMSSMASFFAALTNKAQVQQQHSLMESAQNLMIPNFQKNLVQKQQQQDISNNPLHHIAAAAAMSSFKFNPFAGIVHEEILQKQQQQQQLQQTYQASLAKFMSFCQDNYMQRLFAEKYSQQLQNNSNQRARFHPYSKQSMSINTSASSPVHGAVTSSGSSASYSLASSSFRRAQNPESPTFSSLESPQSSPKVQQFLEGKLSVSPSSSTSSALLSPPTSSTGRT